MYVCSQTGFNIISHDEVTVIQDTVAYLPTINAPATQMSTINSVLRQSINIKYLHGLKKMSAH